MKTLLFLLLPMAVQGQIHILQSMHAQARDMMYHSYPQVCPWQSVRLTVEGYQTYQLDIRGTEAELAGIDLYMVIDAMDRIWQAGTPVTNLPLLAAGLRVDFHSSITAWPLGEHWERVSYKDGYQDPRESGINVGAWQFIELRPVNMIYGLLKLPDGKFQISFSTWVKTRKN